MNLKTRLENLEKKMFTLDGNLPSCIVITSENGRLDAEPDTSKIVRFTTNDKIFDRKIEESENDFTARVVKIARTMLPAHGIPVLLAATKNMLKG